MYVCVCVRACVCVCSSASYSEFKKAKHLSFFPSLSLIFTHCINIS